MVCRCWVHVCWYLVANTSPLELLSAGFGRPGGREDIQGAEPPYHYKRLEGLKFNSIMTFLTLFIKVIGL